MQKPRVMRMAMPVSIPSDVNQKMRGTERGWAFDPEAKKGALPVGHPDLGKKVLEDVAPGFDLTLPKIYRYSPNDIKTINGKKCLVVDFEVGNDSKRTKATPKRVMDRLIGNHYPGVVRTINLETGLPEEFNYDDVFDQVKAQSEAISEETRAKVNKEIQSYNKRIDEIDAATANLTRIPLQIAKAEGMVRERIQTLDAMIAGTQAKISETQSQKPEGMAEYEGHIDQSISGGNLNEKDFIDFVTSKYAHKYDQLVKDLQSGAIAVPASIPDPANLKLKLMNMGQAAFDDHEAEAKKKKEDEGKLPAKPFDIEQQDIVGNLQELQHGDVPSTNKSTGFYNLEGYIKSLYATVKSCEKNRDALIPIADGMAELAQKIGGLPPGQRSQDHISGPEGQDVLYMMADLCNNKLKGWSETFSRDIVDEFGRIDTRHFGKSGSVGNAMLIVTLTRLFKILSTFLKKSGYKKPDEALINSIADGIDAGQHEQVPVQVPTQASVKKTVKVANGEWTPGMASAYTAGLNDGKSGSPMDVSKSKGFDACYKQGYNHGIKQSKPAQEAPVATHPQATAKTVVAGKLDEARKNPGKCPKCGVQGMKPTEDKKAYKCKSCDHEVSKWAITPYEGSWADEEAKRKEAKKEASILSAKWGMTK